jgi:hypothetical protein
MESRMSQRPLQVLLLADDQRGHAQTIHDHIQALRQMSRHRVELFNPRGLGRSRFLPLERFDVVVVHYSLVLIWDDYVSAAFRERLGRFEGLKIQFLQDEYRHVDDMTAAMRDVGIDILFSVVPEAEAKSIYSERLPNTQIIPTLTGFVPDCRKPLTTRPLRTRPIDVGYRGRSLPYWLGRLAFEKVEVGRGFLAHAAGRGLRMDIGWSERERIYGARWLSFVSACRTMLGSESGASIVDFNGSVVRAVQTYLASHPLADYEEVEAAVLNAFSPSPRIATVSPRVFEAASLRTPLVMFPGEYSGVVQPWNHYVPLEKDFSNIDEVVAKIRDVSFLEELAERTHTDLIASGRYSLRAFVREFDDVIAGRAKPSNHELRYPRYRLAAEQASAGRTYLASSLYNAAREVILAYVGAREGLRHGPLVQLARACKTFSLNDDLLRLAVLRSVQESSLFPSSGAFRVTSVFDETEGHLILTSRPADTSVGPDPTARGVLREAMAAGRVRQIVWNHAPVGQYISFYLRPLRRSIAFDVGRNDTYGVYRFNQLVDVASAHPMLVYEAIEPLLATTPASDDIS